MGGIDAGREGAAGDPRRTEGEAGLGAADLDDLRVGASVDEIEAEVVGNDGEGSLDAAGSREADLPRGVERGGEYQVSDVRAGGTRATA